MEREVAPLTTQRNVALSPSVSWVGVAEKPRMTGAAPEVPLVLVEAPVVADEPLEPTAELVVVEVVPVLDESEPDEFDVPVALVEVAPDEVAVVAAALVDDAVAELALVDALEPAVEFALVVLAELVPPVLLSEELGTDAPPSVSKQAPIDWLQYEPAGQSPSALQLGLESHAHRTNPLAMPISPDRFVLRNRMLAPSKRRVADDRVHSSVLGVEPFSVKSRPNKRQGHRLAAPCGSLWPKSSRPPAPTRPRPE
jgi:hypothetical protein